VKRLFFSLRIVFVVLLVTLALNVHPAFAAVTGSLTTLTFPGASATNCGIEAVAVGGSVTTTELVSDIGTLTDGNGTVIGGFSISYDGPVEGPFTATYISYSIQPAKNPIRMVEVLGGVTVVDLSADNPCLPPSGGISGPPIPSGFVMKTITCDVAVFDAPGGKPVGGNAIKSGQTWYVNPTPKKDAAGKAWTEVFVAGYTNGYVPTSCVH
jgi:hypothetical protein